MANKKHYGVCRMCREHKALTFEHVPPRSANNNHPVNAIPASSVLDGSFAAGNGVKGPVLQRGSGGYYFCAKCNSSLSPYNIEYAKLANDLTPRIIGTFRAIGEENFFNPLMKFDFSTEKFRPARVVRSVASNFITMDSHPKSKLLNPLREFVCDPGTKWAENARLFLAISWGTHVRNFGPYSSNSGSCIFETSFPPFSWTLLIDDDQDPSSLGVDVTDWCGLDTEEVASFSWTGGIWKTDADLIPVSIRGGEYKRGENVSNSPPPKPV